jgi:hypothetical protein
MLNYDRFEIINYFFKKINTAGEAPTVRILLKEKQNNCTVVQRTQEGETKQARKRGRREARELKKQEQLQKKRLPCNSKDTPSFFWGKQKRLHLKSKLVVNKTCLLMSSRSLNY